MLHLYLHDVYTIVVRMKNKSFVASGLAPSAFPNKKFWVRLFFMIRLPHFQARRPAELCL